MGDAPASQPYQGLGMSYIYIMLLRAKILAMCNIVTLMFNSLYTSLLVMHVSCLSYPIIDFVTDNARTYQPTYIIYLLLYSKRRPKTSFSI